MVDIALTVKVLTACLVWHHFLIALSYYTLSLVNTGMGFCIYHRLGI